MSDVRPLKANYGGGSVVSSISEFTTGDTVPVVLGGTGTSSFDYFASSIVSSLQTSDLADVSAVAPTDYQALIFDPDISKYIPSSLPAGGGGGGGGATETGDLTDVSAVAPTDYQALIFHPGS